MITDKMRRIGALWTVAASTVLLMAACGGGGGNPGGGADGESPSTSSGELKIQYKNLEGEAITAISPAQTARAEVALTRFDGGAIGNQRISFEEVGGLSLLEFSPATRSVATNSNGVAIIDFKPATLSSLGATTISASTTLSDETIEVEENISIVSGQAWGSFSLDIVDASGVSTSRLAAGTSGAVKVTLNRPDGGNDSVLVVFSEESPTGTALLAFSPTTALTDGNGEAEVDVTTVSSSVRGTTTIVATATPLNGGEVVEVSKYLEIAQDPRDPQTLAASINFVEASPSDQSIVVAGSGGLGRSQTALLTFEVLDENQAPLRGVTVEFSLSDDGLTGDQAPRLLSTEAVTNADGLVRATVLSGTSPTSVVVYAQVKDSSPVVSSQSGAVTVTTASADQRHFDISASRWVVDLGTSGDSSDISIMLADANGNPVADSVAVVTTTDFGRVGTSDRGGCLLSDGTCTVQYLVQNPRPTDGQEITVLAAARLGDGSEISDEFILYGSRVEWLSLWNSAIAGSSLTSLTPSGTSIIGTCQFSPDAYLGTPAGVSAPTGSTISVTSLTEGLDASIEAGSPVLNTTARSQLRLIIKGSSGTTGDAPTPAVTSGGLLFTVTSNNGNVTTFGVNVSGITGC